MTCPQTNGQVSHRRHADCFESQIDKVNIMDYSQRACDWGNEGPLREAVDP